MKNQGRIFLVNLLHSTVFLLAAAIIFCNGFFLVKAFVYPAQIAGIFDAAAKASSIILVIEGFIVLALTLHGFVLHRCSPAIPQTIGSFPSSNP